MGGRGVSGTEGLLDYLRQVGSLSAQQLDYLRQRGFLPAPPRPVREVDDDEEWNDLTGDHADEDDLALPVPRKRGGGGRRDRGADLKAAALAEQLEEWLGRRRGALEGVAALMRRPGETCGPREVLRRLRRQEPDELAEVLRAALAGAVSVEQVWTFLELDEFREVGRDAPGPAPQAYRMLLAARQEEPPVKYAWLLREEAVAAVYDLLVAQGRLLAAAGRLHAADAEVLREGLRKRPHPLAFWVLLLLFNVDLNEGKVGKASGQRMLVPRRPDSARWRRAWEQALRMDAARVLPFFATLHACPATPEGEAIEAPLYCPTRWAPLVYRFSS